MDDYTQIATEVRSGQMDALSFSRWLAARKQLWVVADGEFDPDGTPVNIRPIVLNHTTGAAISVIFTDKARADAWRNARKDRATRKTIVAPGTPAEVFAELLLLPIDGMVINPDDAARLNAGRSQIESLAKATAAG